MTTLSPVPVPPDLQTVIGRTLCLSSLVVRGMLESAILLAHTTEDLAAYQNLANRLSRWLNDQDFTAQFTVDELDALSAMPGTWSSTQHEMQSARVEATGVLLWALSLQDVFPPYDRSFPIPDLQPLLGWTPDAITAPLSECVASFPYNGADLLAGITQLRPQPSIASQRSAAECWRWRVKVAALQRSGVPSPAGQDYDMMIGIAAEEAYTSGAIGRPISNDFPFNERPFSRLSESGQAKCGELAAYRGVALDWLCGYATAWDTCLQREAESALTA